MSHSVQKSSERPGLSMNAYVKKKYTIKPHEKRTIKLISIHPQCNKIYVGFKPSRKIKSLKFQNTQNYIQNFELKIDVINQGDQTINLKQRKFIGKQFVLKEPLPQYQTIWKVITTQTNNSSYTESELSDQLDTRYQPDSTTYRLTIASHGYPRKTTANNLHQCCSNFKVHKGGKIIENTRQINSGLRCLYWWK